MAFQRACATSEVREDQATAVSLDGIDVAVAKDGEDFYAVQDLCSHAHVALSEGEVADCAIECWLHGSTFDLRTGKPMALPASEPVATFAVEVRGDDVFVDVTTPLNGVTPA
ncbi:non-heme iron oxygenase ferredoxin subunit [Nocardioides campestrisoli]|uniref:non-heme iron oxygenase ferredoxin subunit n=1 Tax=Nocardioides campestrisoli TaxID=2736757 RepID=UPI00163DABD0|nr:non-heme iron oxygenase ferredoxin subunit [Nocardioides campestrisoli]